MDFDNRDMEKKQVIKYLRNKRPKYSIIIKNFEMLHIVKSFATKFLMKRSMLRIAKFAVKRNILRMQDC